MAVDGFSINHDPAHGVLRLTLTGYWSPPTLKAFADQLLLVAGKLKVARIPFGVLSDSRHFDVQSADVSDGFTRLMASAGRVHDGRTAIVVGSMINKLQAERAMGSTRLRVFLDMAEAEAWLASPVGNRAG